MQDWRILANEMQAEIHTLIKIIFDAKKNIDKDYPNWRVKRDNAPDKYWEHDARREAFATIQTILETASLNYFFISKYATDKSWWTEYVEEVSNKKIDSVIKEYAIMIKWFTFHSLAMTVEETFRAIQRSEPNVFKIDGRMDISKIYLKVLEVVNRSDAVEFFDILRHTRNSIHTKGIYLPENPKEHHLTKSFKGETLKFEYGKILDWFDDKRLIWFVGSAVEIVESVVKSPAVSDIPDCPRGIA